MNHCLPIQDSAVLGADASRKDARGLTVHRLVERVRSLGGRYARAERAGTPHNEEQQPSTTRWLFPKESSHAVAPPSERSGGSFRGLWNQPEPGARFSRRRLLATRQ